MTRATNPSSGSANHNGGQQNGGPNVVLDLGLTKVVGGAFAAVTTALAASFFGVTGTLAGAAFGSIVYTVAAEIYAHSLNTARSRIRTTRTVVPRPYDQGRPDSAAVDPNDPTSVPADLTGRSVPLPGERSVLPSGAPAPPASGPPGGSSPPSSPRPAARWRPTWKPVAMFAGFIFLVAMATISVTEFVIGHPVSNSNAKGTTTVSGLFDPPARAATTKPTRTSPSETSSSSTTESSSTSDSGSPSTDVSGTSQSSDSGQVTPPPSDTAGNPVPTDSLPPIAPQPSDTGGSVGVGGGVGMGTGAGAAGTGTPAG